jgi:hypothetical protein
MKSKGRMEKDYQFFRLIFKNNYFLIKQGRCLIFFLVSGYSKGLSYEFKKV